MIHMIYDHHTLICAGIKIRIEVGCAKLASMQSFHAQLSGAHSLCSVAPGCRPPLLPAVAGNTGFNGYGAVYAQNGSLAITGCQFQNNSAQGGAALGTQYLDSLVISDTVFAVCVCVGGFIQFF